VRSAGVRLAFCAAPRRPQGDGYRRGGRTMRKFYTLLSREVRSYFYSPIAYVVLLFFLFVSGADFYFQLSFMNGKPVSYSVEEAFFNSIFFWFAFVLIFPLITMRLFAEEFKLGTIEPLMTAPVRDWQVVLSKFFGALIFYLVLWLPTLIYFWVFQSITHQPAAGSRGAYFGAYLMLLLLGMFYLSIGCLASALTKNQIVAAVISFCAITLHFFSGLISFILQEVSSTTRQLLGYFSAIEQMGTLSRGEIDTRPIVLYVSMTVMMLILTHMAFQSRKWKL
jgi:ABC-2 type transport system permease protein